MANGAATPRKRTAKKKAMPKRTPEPEEVQGEVVDDQPEEVSRNGVFIIREDNGDPGKLNVSLQVVGDVRLTEIETLLKVGLKTVRTQLELDD